MRRGVAFVVGGAIGVFFGVLLIGAAALVWVVLAVATSLSDDREVTAADCRSALPLHAVRALGFEVSSASVTENQGACEFVPDSGGISIQATDYDYGGRSGDANRIRSLTRATEECADPLFGPPADYAVDWLGLADEPFGCVVMHENDRFGRGISVLVLDPSGTEVITIDISQDPDQVSASQGWRGPVAEIARSARSIL